MMIMLVDDDINVPFGATITFDTTVQPSDYRVGD